MLAQPRIVSFPSTQELTLFKGELPARLLAQAQKATTTRATEDDWSSATSLHHEGLNNGDSEKALEGGFRLLTIALNNGRFKERILHAYEILGDCFLERRDFANAEIAFQAAHQCRLRATTVQSESEGLASGILNIWQCQIAQRRYEQAEKLLTSDSEKRSSLTEGRRPGLWLVLNAEQYLFTALSCAMLGSGRRSSKFVNQVVEIGDRATDIGRLTLYRRLSRTFLTTVVELSEWARQPSKTVESCKLLKAATSVLDKLADKHRSQAVDDARIELRMRRAIALELENKLPNAQPLYTESIDIASKSCKDTPVMPVYLVRRSLSRGNGVVSALGLLNLSKASEIAGSMDDAYYMACEAQTLYESSEADFLKPAVSRRLGEIEDQRGNYANAVQWYKEAYKQGVAVYGSRYGREAVKVAFLETLSLIKLKDPTKAWGAFTRSFEAASRHYGANSKEIFSLTEKGIETFYLTGNYYRASLASRKSTEIAENFLGLNSPQFAAHALIAATRSLEVGDIPQTTLYYQMGTDALHSSPYASPKTLIRLYSVRSALSFSTPPYTGNDEFFNKALKIIERLPAHLLREAELSLRSHHIDLLLNAGRVDDALIHAERYITLSEQNPKSGAPYRAFAHSALKFQNVDMALSHFARAVSIEQESSCVTKLTMIPILFEYLQAALTHKSLGERRETDLIFRTLKEVVEAGENEMLPITQSLLKRYERPIRRSGGVSYAAWMKDLLERTNLGSI